MDIMVVEQTKDYPNRMKYDPDTKTFFATEYGSLGHERGCPYPYGWLVSSGTPPEPHLDVLLVSSDDFKLGDEVEVNIIGVFIRGDRDHKLVAVPAGRNTGDIAGLAESEMEPLRKLYPRIDPGEGWFGRPEALQVIDNFIKYGRTYQ